MTLLVIAHCGLDGVLGQDGAMNLDRRQRQFFGDLAVANFKRLIERLALDPLGHQRRRGYGRTAAVGFEAGIFDHALIVDADLQLHHIATRRSAHHAGADLRVVLGKRAHVTRVFIMVHHFVTVSHDLVLLEALAGSGERHIQ